MAEIDEIIQSLSATYPLLKPIVSSAIQALQLPRASTGLDAGCGIGLLALQLGEAVGSNGCVIGLDISSDLLMHAEEVARKSGAEDRINFRAGDVRSLPFKDSAFDWVWSSCCAGYAPSLGTLPTLKELSRVVKPGGTAAILVWSSERLLPGYPHLEARLNATSSGMAPFSQDFQPEDHFMQAVGWLRAIGLEEVSAHTFIGEALAPFSEEVRSALEALIQMRWTNVEAELSERDFREYQRLCLPDSPDFILNQADYYAFYTCSMFWGKVPQAAKKWSSMTN